MPRPIVAARRTLRRAKLLGDTTNDVIEVKWFAQVAISTGAGSLALKKTVAGQDDDTYLPQPRIALQLAAELHTTDFRHGEVQEHQRRRICFDCAPRLIRRRKSGRFIALLPQNPEQQVNDLGVIVNHKYLCHRPSPLNEPISTHRNLFHASKSWSHFQL